MTQTTDPAVDQALKTKHATMWAMGDYAAVAAEVVGRLGPRLVSACGIGAGDRVLDVAAGSGNAAVPAAATGASVVATDLTPELLDAGRAVASRADAELEWQVADAEALPFDEASFDVVMSCIGVMFAPHHQASADELVRVCRPGGRIGLLSWTPDGFVGQMFAVLKGYVPAPPPGASPPPLWGDQAHVRGLLGDRVREVQARREVLGVDRFVTPVQFRDYFKTHYGPTVAAYRGLAGTDRADDLDRELVELARRHLDGAGSMDWEYLLVTAVRT